MPTGTCPDRNALEKLLLGKLPAAEQTSLSLHLEHCKVCTSVAGTLSLSDDVTDAIRMRKPLQGDEEILSRAIERGKQLGSQLQTVQPDVTAIGHQPADTIYIPSATSDDGTFDFLAPAQLPDEIGRLGGYRVLKVLGVGGMGMVFLAEDPSLKRQIALKVMKPSVAATRSAKDRFLREAQFTASIEHDNIVSSYQVGEDQGVPFIAMPFLKGESLKTRLEREGKLSQTDVLKIGVQVASGLAAAHERNLIHRDIKPDNIWLEEKTGRAKILDFGLVRPVTDDAGLTQSGTILGTPRYMAPEQALGEDVDFRCDLFSLGSVLYHLVSGQLPFQGNNVTATLMAVVQQDAKPLESLVPELHPTFCKLVKKLLTKDRNKRPASAKEVAKFLTAIYQDLKKTTAASKTEDTRSRIRENSEAPDAAASELSRVQLPDSLAEVVRLRTSNDSPELPHITAIPDRPKTSTTPRTQQTTPPRKPPGKKFLAARGAGGLLLMLGILIITIRDKDGKETTVRTPSGIEIDVDAAPGSKVTIREEGMPSHPSSISNLKSKIKNSPGWHGWSIDAPPPAIVPFDTAQAKKHQQAWADYLKLPVEYTNALGMKFVLIPPGEFTMGGTLAEIEATLKDVSDDKHWQDCIRSEAPRHKVILTQPFYLSVHEATQAEYEKIMGKNPSHFSLMGAGKEAVAGMDTESHPVESVSWNDAAEFCAKLSQQEKLKPFYFRVGETTTPLGGTGYRLPTEAEWEFACRSGTTSRFWIGDKDEDLMRCGWYGWNSGGRTHAIGALNANPFGLFDIHGNIAEWVEDCWDSTYYRQFTETPAIAPRLLLDANSRRVRRGGDWRPNPSGCRAATRHSIHPAGYDYGTGFRVALTVGAVKAGLVGRNTKPATVPSTTEAPSVSR